FLDLCQERGRALRHETPLSRQPTGEAFAAEQPVRTIGRTATTICGRRKVSRKYCRAPRRTRRASQGLRWAPSCRGSVQIRLLPPRLFNRRTRVKELNRRTRVKELSCAGL